MRRTTSGSLLDEIAQRDIRLSLDGDRLRINAPRGAMDNELKAKIAARRDDIIARLRTSRTAPQDQGADAIRRIPRSGPLPVSAAQQRLWFLNQMDPGSTYYNIGGGLRLRGKLDHRRSQASDPCSDRPARGVPHRHRRTRRPALADDIRDILRACRCTRSFGASGRRAGGRMATREARRLLRTPFDMARGPLAAFLIVRLGEDDHILFLVDAPYRFGWLVSGDRLPRDLCVVRSRPRRPSG